jgi:hypothetical protein
MQVKSSIQKIHLIQSSRGKNQYRTIKTGKRNKIKPSTSRREEILLTLLITLRTISPGDGKQLQKATEQNGQTRANLFQRENTTSIKQAKQITKTRPLIYISELDLSPM